MLNALRQLIYLAPIAWALFALAGGSIVSAGAVWKFKDWWHVTISEPQIRSDQRAKDVEEFEAIAEEAKRQRELEIFKFVERLQQEFWDQQQEADDWHSAEVGLLEDRIKDYEQALGDDGVCGLTDGDLLFLGGVQQERGVAGRGHGQGASGSPAAGPGGAGRLH